MKQTQKQGQKNRIGAIGEQITAVYLEKHGFKIISINYLKKYGEIDIVARETIKNNSKIHFIEVKTVSYETKRALQEAVLRGTWRPEENVHQKKLRRLHRTIEAWLYEYNYNGDWQIDVAAVRIVPQNKYATIKILFNIIN